MRWFFCNPVRTMAVVTAIVAAVSPYLPNNVTAGLLGVVSAVLGIGVHQAVTPMKKVIKEEGADSGVWHS